MGGAKLSGGCQVEGCQFFNFPRGHNIFLNFHGGWGGRYYLLTKISEGGSINSQKFPRGSIVMEPRQQVFPRLEKNRKFP